MAMEIKEEVKNKAIEMFSDLKAFLQKEDVDPQRFIAEFGFGAPEQEPMMDEEAPEDVDKGKVAILIARMKRPEEERMA